MLRSQSWTEAALENASNVTARWREHDASEVGHSGSAGQDRALDARAIARGRTRPSSERAQLLGSASAREPSADRRDQAEEPVERADPRRCRPGRDRPDLRATRARDLGADRRAVLRRLARSARERARGG